MPGDSLRFPPGPEAKVSVATIQRTPDVCASYTESQKAADSLLPVCVLFDGEVETCGEHEHCTLQQAKYFEAPDGGAIWLIHHVKMPVTGEEKAVIALWFSSQQNAREFVKRLGEGFAC